MLVYAGLDGEMSSNTAYDMTDGQVTDGMGRLIQAGISFNRVECISVNIGWDEGYMLWSEQAAAVHKIPLEAVTKEFPPAKEADDVLYQRVREIYPEGERFIASIGWNVASFDLPFFRFALPRFFSLLSRRTVDLNAVVKSMDGLFSPWGSPISYKGLKRLSKLYARVQLAQAGVPYRPHDAGWDAQMSLLCYDYLRLMMVGEAPDLSNVDLPEDE